MNRFQQLLIAALTAVVTTACASVPASSQEPWFSQAEIDQMLAPVALYPDSVLSHVLIAATYPLEVVQAARWSRENPGLDGEVAVAAVEYQDWDPSVKALVAFPELLKRMDDDIGWTQRLGDAFMVQEADVVASIQHLRDQAYASGHLRSNEHVRVVRETKVIYIEPVRTRTVYVPYYDPRVVYGSWRWSAYPPVYWHHPPRYVSGVSFYWGPAYHIAPSFYFSSFHWSRQQVVVVNHNHYYGGRHFRSGREVANYREARHWRHNPHHRRGVSYHRGVADNRFVERSTTSTTSTRGQASAPRELRQRSQQREWAADQRRSLNLREQSSSQANQQRSSATNQRRSQAVATARSNGSTERSDSRRAVQARQSTPAQGSTSTRAQGRASTQPTLNSRERVQRSQPQLQERLGRERSPERSQRVAPSSSSRPAPTRRAGIEIPDSMSASRDMPRSRSSAPSRNSRAPEPAAPRPVMPSRSAPVRSAPAQSAPSRSAPIRSAPSRSAPAPSSMPSAPPPQRSAPAQRTRGSAPSRSETRSRASSRDGGEQRRQR